MPHSTSSAPAWHASAPQQLRRECRPGEDGLGWECWQRHLAERLEPPSLVATLPGRFSSWPLQWGMQSPTESGRADHATRPTRSAQAVIAPHPAGEPRAAWRQWAVDCLAQATRLPQLADRLTASEWWSLWEQLVCLAESSQPIRERPVATWLVSGELPLLLAYLFPESIACRQLWKPALLRVQQAIDDWFDGEGLPHSDLIHDLRPLLASLTRIAALARHDSRFRITQEVASAHSWLVHHAIQWSRANGSTAFGASELARGDRELLAVALELAGDDEDWAAAQASLPSHWTFRKESRAAVPWPSNRSEWAGLAVLRTDWARRAPRLFVNYGSDPLELEVETTGGTILTGSWDATISCDGELAVPRDPWEELCWISDDDADFLELEQTLTEGVRVQRQVLLARRTQVAWLCDYVLSERPAKLTYQARLPLAAGVRFEQETETHDGRLLATSPLAVLIPLALPEWKIGGQGCLEQRAQELVLQHPGGDAQHLACPLFIDLGSRRTGRPRTWRQLTVAERLQIQPPEVAAGYRVQCGRQQWLFYRSLAAPANRTVLGQNLTSEFFAAEFHATGDTTPLVDIE